MSLLGLAAALAGVVSALIWALVRSHHGEPLENTPNGQAKTKSGTAWELVDGSLAPLLLLALFFFLGAAWARVDLTSKRSTLLDDLNTHLYLIGRVAEEPRVYANRTVYVLEAWEVRQGDWREAVREKVEVSVYRPRGKAQGGGGLGGGQAGEKKGRRRPGRMGGSRQRH